VVHPLQEDGILSILDGDLQGRDKTGASRPADKRGGHWGWGSKTAHVPGFQQHAVSAADCHVPLSRRCCKPATLATAMARSHFPPSTTLHPSRITCLRHPDVGCMVEGDGVEASVRAMPSIACGAAKRRPAGRSSRVKQKSQGVLGPMFWKRSSGRVGFKPGSPTHPPAKTEGSRGRIGCCNGHSQSILKLNGKPVNAAVLHVSGILVHPALASRHCTAQRSEHIRKMGGDGQHSTAQKGAMGGVSLCTLPLPATTAQHSAAVLDAAVCPVCCLLHAAGVLAQASLPAKDAVSSPRPEETRQAERHAC